MINKKYKLLLLITLLIIPFMVTGCGKNNSAKDVAVEMVKSLSNDNYKGIGDIFYQEKNSYFDEEAFKEKVKEENLNISGNKKIKVKEVGDEITDSNTGNIKVAVKIEIDDNKIFNVNAMKVNNKWYVYEPDFYDGTIEIEVPAGSKVKFNGKELNKKYKSTKEVETKAYYPDSYKSVKLENVKMDVYTINNVIDGKYSVSIKGKNTQEVKDVIYTYSESGEKSGNYTKNSSYSSKTATYTFKVKNSDKKVDSFVKDYLNNIYSNTSTGSFDGVEKYFDKSSDEYDLLKNNYQSLLKSTNKSESSYISDFKIDDYKSQGSYYYNDNNIVVMYEYKLNYKSNYSNSSYDRSRTSKSILVLKKNSKGNYVITDGYDIFLK